MKRLDEHERRILAERVKLRRQRTDPLVGDWVDFPDGHSERIGYVWSDGLQTSETGDFYLCETGNGSFSGNLNHVIGMKHFADTEKTRPGRFWVFYHDVWTAHGGVHCEVPCRVWRCDCMRGQPRKRRGR
jgi:hypothetical protein